MHWHAIYLMTCYGITAPLAWVTVYRYHQMNQRSSGGIRSQKQSQFVIGFCGALFATLMLAIGLDGTLGMTNLAAPMPCNDVIAVFGLIGTLLSYCKYAAQWRKRNVSNVSST